MNLELRERSVKLVPYYDLLFYVELLYLTVMIFYVYGALIALTIGGVLTILLSFLIVNIYFGGRRAKLFQLIIFDIHIPLVVAYIFSKCGEMITAGYIFDPALILRVPMLITEIFLVFMMTEE